MRIAGRAGELPECFALFQAGILGEDAMVRIARRVPADPDMDVAASAPEMLVCGVAWGHLNSRPRVANGPASE